MAAAVWALTMCAHAAAQGASAEDANKSNNPLNAATGANFQDYCTPRLYGTGVHTNDFLLRAAQPFPKPELK